MSAINLALTLYLVVCAGLIVQIRDISPFRRTAAAAPAAKDEQYSELVNSVHRQVNEFRREHGLKPLTLDPSISAEAREHSAEMARSGKTLGHRGFNQRLEDIRKKIPYRAAAENVAAAAGYEDPARTVVEGWKNSREHRKNMLGDFSLTGIGVAQSSNGTYFFTQIFVEPMK
ncbi:MAG TPA: CAP domain-containing protein [Candidatus Binatia bacterium]|jgi:uncharacterized protein YkwD